MDKRAEMDLLCPKCGSSCLGRNPPQPCNAPHSRSLFKRTDQVEEVDGDVAQHARERGAQDVLHGAGPALVALVFVQVIDVLQSATKTCQTQTCVAEGRTDRIEQIEDNKRKLTTTVGSRMSMA